MNEGAPLERWLVLSRASVSRRTVAIGCSALGCAALALIALLVATPRALRDQRAYEVAFEVMRATPPTDEILRQMPPDRLESVRMRGQALVARALQPMLIASALLFALVGLGYAAIARPMRARFARMRVPRRADTPWRRGDWLIFAGFSALALLAHWPYAANSLRFDEDLAGLQASHGWFAWANNLVGWQCHVGALLSIRLSTAIFGLNVFAVRLPAVLISSLSLAALGRYLWQRFSPWLACCTVCLIAIVPLWAEQTSLARGYGLAFSAASWMTLGVLRLHAEGDQPRSASVFAIGAAVCVGSLAHFFFVFFVAGMACLLISERRRALDLRLALAWWMLLAFIPPGISLAFGAPAVVAQMQQIPSPGWIVIGQRFAEELGFRHAGGLGHALAALAAGLLLTAALLVPRPARRALWTVMGVSVFVPVLMNPVYLYPRFFLHTLALSIPCVAWLISMRMLHARASWNLAALALLLGLGLSTHPWNVLPLVDLRLAARLADTWQREYGERFAVDTYLASGVRFYNGHAGRIVNTLHPLPPDVDRILWAVTHDPNLHIPEPFVLTRRWVGAEHDILLITRKP
jgi:hypothetical protein